MDCASLESKVPYHLEIKIAPQTLWQEGLMPSRDNLRSRDGRDMMWIQIQAVAAMHDRLPGGDLLNVATSHAPVMSVRDALYHGEIIQQMRFVAAAIRLDQPTFALRPLPANHHTYGALRVGTAVSKDFRFRDAKNLFVLPPTAFVDVDDDANPTLKSRALAQYAMDAIVRDLARARRA